MRRLKVISTTILGIGLLVGTTVAAVAQEEEPAELVTPIYYTGTSGEPAEVIEGTFSEDGETMRDQRFIGIPIESSDPRFSGTLDVTANGHAEINDDGGVVIESRSYRSVTEEGSWVGSGTFVQAWDPETDTPHLVQEVATLTGEGGYEGLVAFVTLDHLSGDPFEVVIASVEMPPVPEVPAE